MTYDCARQLGHIHNHQLDVKFVMHDDCQSLTLTIQVQCPAVADRCHGRHADVKRSTVVAGPRSVDDFIRELNQSRLTTDPPSDVDDLFACYDQTIRDVLDKLAPTIEVKQNARSMSPWYDHECYIIKLQTRRLEKTYRRNPTPAKRLAWRSQFSRQRAMYQAKFTSYWSRKINDSAGNSRQLWLQLKRLLSEPAHTATVHSAGDFARHFKEKIDHRPIRQSTSTFPQPCITSRCVDGPLCSFRPVTVDEVATMIRKSLAKQCPLDPIPTWLVKNVCNTVAPIITITCNVSIKQNKFPNCRKSAIVKSLLKKTNLDPSDLNSYRPVSNLSFVSKLLIQNIDSRITKHANFSNLSCATFTCRYEKYFFKNVVIPLTTAI